MCIRNTSEILASLTSIGSCRRWCYYPSLYTWAMTWEISHIYTYIYMSYIYIDIHGLWPEKFLIYIHIHTCRIYTYIYMGYDLRNFSYIYIYIHVIYIHIYTWLWLEKFLMYIHIHTCHIYTYIYMGYDLRNF